jgi:site-specific DNA-cytosine methylase
MSEKSDLLEAMITRVANEEKTLPENIPNWLRDMGIQPRNRILGAKKIGSKDNKNKTDVLIILENAPPIKISAKLENADFFGNWYGHERIVSEFGEETFYKLTNATTNWANRWMLNPKLKGPFVGVSISFGKRTGRTQKDFIEVFNYEDILKIIAGSGDGDNVANCLYISSEYPTSILELIGNLKPINEEVINEIGKEFSVIFRPVYPITNWDDRSKNSYTKFQPYKKLEEPKIITNHQELFSLGKFVEVEPTVINHNHILDYLEEKHNIIIPRKPKKSKLTKKSEIATDNVQRLNRKLKPKIQVVSLFPNLAGLDMGLLLSGLARKVGEEKAKRIFHNKELFHRESDNINYKINYCINSNDTLKGVYSKNFPDTNFYDINEVINSENVFEAQILIGKMFIPFSMVDNSRISNDSIKEYSLMVSKLSPEIFVFETSKELLTFHLGENINLFTDLISPNYKVNYKGINYFDYGGPIFKETLLIIGIRKDLNFNYEFPLPSNNRSLLNIENINYPTTGRNIVKRNSTAKGKSIMTVYTKLKNSIKKLLSKNDENSINPNDLCAKKTDDKVLVGVAEDIADYENISKEEFKRIYNFPNWFDHSLSINQLQKYYKSTTPVHIAKEIFDPITNWYNNNSQ